MMALFVRFLYVCAVDTVEGGGDLGRAESVVVPSPTVTGFTGSTDKWTAPLN
jgi:hypothetical protein